MTRGSKYGAESLIALRSEKRVYLANSYDDLEEQILPKKRVIEVTISNLFSKTYCIQKKNIELYGRM